MYLELQASFLEWYGNLKKVNNFKFPRWAGFDDKLDQSLCMFSDASSKGYGCVVYLRTIHSNGSATFDCACTNLWESNSGRFHGKSVAKDSETFGWRFLVFYCIMYRQFFRNFSTSYYLKRIGITRS